MIQIGGNSVPTMKGLNKSKIMDGTQTIKLYGVGFNKDGSVTYCESNFIIYLGEKIHIKTKSYLLLKNKLRELCSDNMIQLLISNK